MSRGSLDTRLRMPDEDDTGAFCSTAPSPILAARPGLVRHVVTSSMTAGLGKAESKPASQPARPPLPIRLLSVSLQEVVVMASPQSTGPTSPPSALGRMCAWPGATAVDDKGNAANEAAMTLREKDCSVAHRSGTKRPGGGSAPKEAGLALRCER